MENTEYSAGQAAQGGRNIAIHSSFQLFSLSRDAPWLVEYQPLLFLSGSCQNKAEVQLLTKHTGGHCPILLLTVRVSHTK